MFTKIYQDVQKPICQCQTLAIFSGSGRFHQSGRRWKFSVGACVLHRAVLIDYTEGWYKMSGGHQKQQMKERVIRVPNNCWVYWVKSYEKKVRCYCCPYPSDGWKQGYPTTWQCQNQKLCSNVNHRSVVNNVLSSSSLLPLLTTQRMKIKELVFVCGSANQMSPWANPPFFHQM